MSLLLENDKCSVEWVNGILSSHLIVSSIHAFNTTGGSLSVHVDVWHVVVQLIASVLLEIGGHLEVTPNKPRGQASSVLDICFLGNVLYQQNYILRGYCTSIGT